MHGAVSELVRDVSLLNFKKVNLCHRCFIIQVKNGGRHSPTQICRYLRSLLLASLRCNIQYTGIPTNLMKKRFQNPTKFPSACTSSGLTTIPKATSSCSLRRSRALVQEPRSWKKKQNKKRKNKKTKKKRTEK